MTRQNAENANQANLAVNESNKLVESGVGAMTRMTDAINEIKQSSEKIEDALKEGVEVHIRIIKVDPEERKLGLSMKNLKGTEQ